MTDLTGVAVLGGGRWARVLASVLAEVLPNNIAAIVASDGNPDGWAEWLLTRPSWSRTSQISQVLKMPDISHVVIARRARDHTHTVLAALDAGKAVLVEKPFCLTVEDLDLILAKAPSTMSGTGLVFHFAPYHRHFQRACSTKSTATSIALDWIDPIAEVRHGQAKSYDPSLNVLQDVLPHAVSIVRPFLSGPLHVTDVDVSGGGRNVKIDLSAETTAVKIKMQRDGDVRERRLRIDGRDWQAELDFAIEPGRAHIDGSEIDVTNGLSSPLAAELTAFLENRLPPATHFSNAQDAIRLSVAALKQVRMKQAKAILGSDLSAKDYALREIRGGGIRGDGRPATDAAIDAWLTTVT